MSYSKAPGKPITLSTEDIGECKYCGRMIAFATSKRTGKKYPIEIDPDDVNELDDTITGISNNFHQCEERRR